MAGPVLVSVVLYEMSKAFRMLPKSRLGKILALASPDLVTPEFRSRSERSPPRSEPTVKKQTKPIPHIPDPTFKNYVESLKGGESCVLLCRLNLGIRLLGGEERIARGKECYKLRYAGRPTDGVTEVRMRPLPFLDLLCQTEIFHLLSKGALEPFGGFGWGRAAAPAAPYSHPLCTRGSSVSAVHSTQPLRLGGARILGRCQPSSALESCVAHVSSYLIRDFLLLLLFYGCVC